MKNNNRILFLTVFISGMVSLAVEMAASRLLGNVFGTSNLVWAAIIGLILIYLAAGYSLGGRWADRNPSFSFFYSILLLSGLLIALVPLLSRPVLRLAANAFDQLQLGILFGSFTAVLILLAFPITLLGTASPFAIRLALESTENAGRISGKIYAVSTLGSFFGTFLPVLVLIPWVGTYRTFLILAGMLILIALVGLFIHHRKRAVIGLFAAIVILGSSWWAVSQGLDKTTSGLLYETESAYNYIQVIERNGYTYLRLNEGQGIHSVYHPQENFYGGPWEMMLAAPLFARSDFEPQAVKSMAIVGLAAGTTAHQAAKVYPNMLIDGIEIDPKIVDVGYRYFDMDLPNLNVIVQDGRWALAHLSKQYQIISIDAYRPPYIPAHLTTQEFFTIVADHLTDDGVAVINVGRSPEDRRLIEALASTMQTVFPSVYVVDLPNTFNSLIYATKLPSSTEDLWQHYLQLQQQANPEDLLFTIASVAVANLQPEPKPGVVFRDDHAPIEWITNTMVLKYISEPEAGPVQ